MVTRAEQLDGGILFDGSTEDKERWRDAFYGGILGSDQVDGGIGFGSYFKRISVTFENIAILGGSDMTTTVSPGPVLAVQVTAGDTVGVYPIQVTGTVLALHCLIVTLSDGRERLSFHADDDVLEVAYRQVPMSAAMFNALLETTTPP